jgi:hypothetical protein
MWINLSEAEVALAKRAIDFWLAGDNVLGNHDAATTKEVQALRSRIEAAEEVGPEDDAIRQAAQERYLRHPWTDGDVEIDEDAMLSHGDGGTFVMAWVYVRDENAAVENEGE